MEQGAGWVPLASERLERRFPERKPSLTRHQVQAEANRCLYCADAPCVAACPTRIEVPEFIRRIATGNLAGAARTIFESNILGHSCARVCPTEVLCEGACVYNPLGEKPIEIGRLQRHATEFAYGHGLHFFPAGPPTGRRVALIGAGPASLACAHELRRRGHQPVIFEARPRPGGLNTTGVAPYKLQGEDALREVAYVLAIGGVEIRYGVGVGREVTFVELERDFDAIFVGVGLGPDSRLAVPGEHLAGVVGAIELIERLKVESGYRLPADLRSVAVVGGGNTALDVVREMRGLGIEDVVLVYRRDATRMPGYRHEWTAAQLDGARAVWWARPLEVLGHDGHVAGLRCVRTRLAPDPAGRNRLESIPGTEFDLGCQMIVVAIGQHSLGDLLREIPEIELAADGRVVTDPATGATAHPRYFAGGDCANGGKEVVNAAAEGKAAALGIDRYLSSIADGGSQLSD